jgi:hypothetical protein
LLPVITLGGGIRAIYKMPAPARVMSYVAPSRWAFERNMIDEAKDHVCGYLPGPQRWDACPGGGKGVDAATLQVPEATSETNGIRQPAQLTKGTSLRYTYAKSIGVLAAMLAILLGSVLLFLRMRDIL